MACLLLAVLVFVLALIRTLMFMLRGDRPLARSYLGRCGIAAIPAIVGLLILLAAFSVDPLWPDQDETPARRAARLRGEIVSGRVYLTSAVVSAAGLFWLSRASLTSSRSFRPVPRGEGLDGILEADGGPAGPVRL